MGCELGARVCVKAMEHAEALSAFLDFLYIERNASKHTVSAYQSDVQLFLRDCSALNLKDIRRKSVEDFLQSLDWMNPNSVRRVVSSLRHFFRFLRQEKVVAITPMEGILLPKKRFALPKILSEKEVESLLQHAYAQTSPQALKHQTIIEVLYATGMRVSELVGLKPQHILWDDGLIKVLGKGNRERFVLIHEMAAKLLGRYIHSLPPNGVWVFPSPRNMSNPITRQAVFLLLKKYAAQVGIADDRVSPHVLRHAFASHLLERGVELFLIKEMLGHRSIVSTQVYTHVLPQTLKKVLDEHHPLYQGVMDVA